MAGVIEAARVLSQHRFPGSIAFVGLSGEEQGLNGGAILAQHAIDAGWNIDAVVNNDMIGNITGVNGVTNNTTARVFSEGTRYVETESEARQRRFQGGEVDSASRNIARYVDEMADRYIPNLDIMMIYRLDRLDAVDTIGPLMRPAFRLSGSWRPMRTTPSSIRTSELKTESPTATPLNM